MPCQALSGIRQTSHGGTVCFLSCYIVALSLACMNHSHICHVCFFGELRHLFLNHKSFFFTKIFFSVCVHFNWKSVFESSILTNIYTCLNKLFGFIASTTVMSLFIGKFVPCKICGGIRKVN